MSRNLGRLRTSYLKSISRNMNRLRNGNSESMRVIRNRLGISRVIRINGSSRFSS